jgi:hypothetical protein
VIGSATMQACLLNLISSVGSDQLDLALWCGRERDAGGDDGRGVEPAASAVTDIIGGPSNPVAHSNGARLPHAMIHLLTECACCYDSASRVLTVMIHKYV